MYDIHSPLTRGDICFRSKDFAYAFSILPHARGDGWHDAQRDAARHISIHSPHARGDHKDELEGKTWQISIRSPHTRGDVQDALSSAGNGGISIRSPHARGDSTTGNLSARKAHFNPLPSHEGRRSLYCLRVIGGISIHSPHTRGDKHRPEAGSALTISIHSPHTRGDHGAPERGAQKRISIHSPHTRGDDGSAGTARGRLISIHSPHTRGDPSTHGVFARGCHFNPLPSHEGRRRILVLADSSSSFQSTPLTRGETSSTTRTPPHF